MDDQIIISRKTAICASLHIRELHEASTENRPVDFGYPCQACPYPYSGDCKFDWWGTLKPIFQHCERSPRFIRDPNESPAWPLPLPEYLEQIVRKED